MCGVVVVNMQQLMLDHVDKMRTALSSNTVYRKPSHTLQRETLPNRSRGQEARSQKPPSPQPSLVCPRNFAARDFAKPAPDPLLPVFCPPEGIPFPRFGAGLLEGETKESFLDRVEASARRIVGKISEKEYVQRKTTLGTMPRFNRVFEELGVEYVEYAVPSDVLLGLEKRKDASKTVAAAESWKRRGGGATKTLVKKRKAEVAAEAPVESFSDCSSAAESNSVESRPAEEVWAAPVAASTGGLQGEVSRAVSSVRLPFASLLGEDSSDAKAPVASPPREVPTGGASPPKEGQNDSSEEAESASVRRIKKAVEPPQPAGEGMNSLYMGKFLICCF